MSEHESQQEEEPQVEEEELDFEEERCLVRPEVIAKGLSNIRKTAGGQTYAFANLDL